MKNYPEFYTELRGQLRQLQKAQPEVMAGFNELHRSATVSGTLSPKVKELIALGIAVAVRCDGCLAFHIAAALRAGATREEIAEAVGVAVLMGGSPAALYGAQAVEALRQFEVQPKAWASAR